MKAPKHAGDFIKMIETWFARHSVDEADQCAFLAMWMGKLLLSLDEGELRERTTLALAYMMRSVNDRTFLSTMHNRVDH